MLANLTQCQASIQATISDAPQGSVVSVTASMADGTGALSIRGDHLHRAASTIKVPVLIGVARAVDEGRVSLDTRIPIRPDLRVKGSGVLYWLDPGLELSLGDHAWLMIADSDNTASNVCIEAVGIPAIAHAVAGLGMIRSGLNRRFHGRSPRPGEPDNLVSTDDLVRLILAIVNDRAASVAMCTWMRTLLSDQKYTNSIPRYLPGSVTYAGKTGFFDGHNHDCGYLTGLGGTIALAVLTTGFDNRYEAQHLMGTIGQILADAIANPGQAGGA